MKYSINKKETISDLVCDHSHFCQRVKSLKNHIKVNDYFGTLATVLDLTRQTNEKSIKELQRNNKLLNTLKKDLLFLQENYKITDN